MKHCSYRDRNVLNEVMNNLDDYHNWVGTINDVRSYLAQTSTHIYETLIILLCYNCNP